jgi:hypothetical protein
MPEQREHFLDEARSLAAYIEAGGAVARLSLPSADDRVAVAFMVARDEYWALTAERRRARRDTERRR